MFIVNNETLLNRLDRHQKRLCRPILNVPMLTPTYLDYSVGKLFSRRHYHTCLMSTNPLEVCFFQISAMCLLDVVMNIMDTTFVHRHQETLSWVKFARRVAKYLFILGGKGME